VNSLDLQSILEEKTVDGGGAILGKIRTRAALKLPCRWHTQKKAPKPNPPPAAAPINLDRPWKVFLQAPPGNNKSLIVPKFSIDDDNDDLGNALRAPKAFDEEKLSIT
jgi:hypothetical protein